MASRQHTLQDDRRTQKTRKLLAEALKELIAEKGYDAITIQDIIDRANVGRSTFYSHYESKEQLLVGNINFQQALLDAPLHEPEQYPWGVNLSYLFYHTKEHMHLVKSLTKTGSIGILSNFFADLCAGKIVAYCKANYTISKKDLRMIEYKAAAAAGGVVRMLFKWLADGAKTPEQEMISYAAGVLDYCMEAAP
ncbi:TetR/AcrR family transcriptional regulator [Deminuibacter soli]|uniref:TetR/AcrR family transcriptional regulator n=1 Tax=Deminuibacter soli TaxID=2291815 RepID=A0A3E1NMI7_9BACT|nr:TetR/AcrR family transcriptional regulator [Deminuibacter soli]RFM29133.1 TetR/AcrR family transcriptional regulator [Deminuibacter soli]